MKAKNPSFSESAFVQKAGLAASSRGYLGLVMRGKRNLSTKTLHGFSKVLKLDDDATAYFENLVYFNQAKNEDDRSFYFLKMSKNMKGRKTKIFELLESQYHFFTKWYLVPIWNLFSLADARNDNEWIAARMRKKVTKKEIKNAIDSLKNLGLLTESNDGQLKQSEPLINFSDSPFNFSAVHTFHKEMLSKAIDAIDEDTYEDRSTSCVVLTCNETKFKSIRDDIKQFREELMAKYATNDGDEDRVVNIAFQLFHITDPKDNSTLHKQGYLQ